MKSKFILFLGLIYSQIAMAQLPEVASGTLQRIENFESEYVVPRNIDIWLPDSYDGKTKFSVLYMHDGQMLYDAQSTWNKKAWEVDEIIAKLIQEGKIKNCIVVGIWNAGKFRHNEYFPQKPFESLTPLQQDTIYKVNRSENNPLFSAKITSDKYLKFIVKELKPFIDGKFKTKKGRKHTLMMGSSMGGLISMYAMCEYPKIFGGTACLSTHWTGTHTTHNNPIPAAFINYLAENLPSPQSHKIYFDHGTATLDALYPAYQKQVDALMLRKGFTAKNWITEVFEGEEHSEEAWQKRLHIPLQFLLEK